MPPAADGDGTTSDSVFARALGQPGGGSTLTTCATDVATGEEVCSNGSLVAVRTSGKQKLDNVSAELLFINSVIDGEGVAERVSPFDDALDISCGRSTIRASASGAPSGSSEPPPSSRASTPGSGADTA